jgi:hypothetical protein
MQFPKLIEIFGVLHFYIREKIPLKVEGGGMEELSREGGGGERAGMGRAYMGVMKFLSFRLL